MCERESFVCFFKLQEDKLEEEEGFKRSKRIEGGMTGKVIGKKKKAELSL